MKESPFKLKRLDDFAAEMEREVKENPLRRSPFGMSRDGTVVGGWEMAIRRIGMFTSTGGVNIFSKSEMILITVPPTETGIAPTAADIPFGWTGKINEYTAEMAVLWAFELLCDSEADKFLKDNKPTVIFSYFDSDGPGEITVKYNGMFWEII